MSKSRDRRRRAERRENRDLDWLIGAQPGVERWQRQVMRKLLARETREVPAVPITLSRRGRGA